jgi:hypothetical protein
MRRLPLRILASTSVTGALLLLTGLSCASAAQTVRLSAAFEPDQLGARTTIVFGFQVRTVGQESSPVTSVDLSLPRGMGLLTTDLGLAGCTSQILIAQGLGGCPTNSLIGFGDAAVQVPLGSQTIHEPVALTALMGPERGEHESVLFYANGRSPIFAQLVFPAEVLEASGPFKGKLDTSIPLIATLPEAPDATVTDLSSTIGPRDLTYHRRVHGRSVAFHPRGVRIPRTCPRGGFPFAADLRFQDGIVQRATTRVPCPR